ncbi:MAG: Maf family protein [Lachnospiraceae bacterium]|nr:Maf family protein [Lachnospiraceae bacterium]MDE6697883.1 Maf family protein [Lachnospiraceae bacterium]
MKKIILASASPRRKELLTQIGLEFEVIVSEADENISADTPENLVMQLSAIKAGAVYEEHKISADNTLIIGADTVVAMNGQVLGKPKDKEQAKEMLKALSDNKHEVLTGVTIIFVKSGNIVKETFYEKTIVYTYPMTDSEIDEYIESGEPMDKAGSYGIQGIGAKFIKKIDGDYNNVVGLPISRIYQKIKEM